MHNQDDGGKPEAAKQQTAASPLTINTNFQTYIGSNATQTYLNGSHTYFHGLTITPLSLGVKPAPIHQHSIKGGETHSEGENNQAGGGNQMNNPAYQQDKYLSIHHQVSNGSQSAQINGGDFSVNTGSVVVRASHNSTHLSLSKPILLGDPQQSVKNQNAARNCEVGSSSLSKQPPLILAQSIPLQIHTPENSSSTAVKIQNPSSIGANCNSVKKQQPVSMPVKPWGSGTTNAQQQQLQQQMAQRRLSMKRQQQQQQQIANNRSNNNSNNFGGTISALNDPIPPIILNQSKVIINISKCTYDIVKEVAKNDLGWRVTRNENFNSEWDVYFADLGIDSEHLAQMKPYQKINHFPAMYLIARKTFLGKNLKKLMKLCPDDYQFFPRTWILPQEANDLRYYTQNYYKRQASLCPSQANNSGQQQQQQPLESGSFKFSQSSPRGKELEVVKGAQKNKLSKKEKKASVTLVNEQNQNLNATSQKQNKEPIITKVPSQKEDVQARNSSEGDFGKAASDATTASEQTPVIAATSSIINEIQKVTPEKQQHKQQPSIDLFASPTNSKLSKQFTLSNNQQQPQQQKRYLTLIVKPDCLSQGKGIFLTNNVDEVFIASNNSAAQNERIVVQEYLKEPYLIDNLKFDIRLYVLITSCDPLKIFLYHDGIVRFATEEFKAGALNSSNIDNMFIHLTNYAINKDNSRFKHSKNALDDEGHKRSYQTVLNRLRNLGHDVDTLLLQINDIIVKTMLSIQPDLLHNYRTCQPADRECSMCFELLGFDIILDKNLRPYLLEVNHAPSFNTDTPLDYLIKKNLLNDTLKLLGMSVEEKRKILQRMHDMKHQRLLQKQTLKEKIDNATKQLKEKLRMRDQYELENLGGYDRIYPLASDDPRQIRYNEIVKAVYNNEADVQIRKVTNNISSNDVAKKQGQNKKVINKQQSQTQSQAPQSPNANSIGCQMNQNSGSSTTTAEQSSNDPPKIPGLPSQVHAKPALTYSQRLALAHQCQTVVFKKDPNYIPPDQQSTPQKSHFLHSLGSVSSQNLPQVSPTPQQHIISIVDNDPDRKHSYSNNASKHGSQSIDPTFYHQQQHHHNINKDQMLFLQQLAQNGQAVIGGVPFTVNQVGQASAFQQSQQMFGSKVEQDVAFIQNRIMQRMKQSQNQNHPLFVNSADSSSLDYTIDHPSTSESVPSANSPQQVSGSTNKFGFGNRKAFMPQNVSPPSNNNNQKPSQVQKWTYTWDNGIQQSFTGTLYQQYANLGNNSLKIPHSQTEFSISQANSYLGGAMKAYPKFIQSKHHIQSLNCATLPHQEVIAMQHGVKNNYLQLPQATQHNIPSINYLQPNQILTNDNQRKSDELHYAYPQINIPQIFSPPSNQQSHNSKEEQSSILPTKFQAQFDINPMNKQTAVKKIKPIITKGGLVVNANYQPHDNHHQKQQQSVLQSVFNQGVYSDGILQGASNNNGSLSLEDQMPIFPNSHSRQNLLLQQNPFLTNSAGSNSNAPPSIHHSGSSPFKKFQKPTSQPQDKISVADGASLPYILEGGSSQERPFFNATLPMGQIAKYQKSFNPTVPLSIGQVHVGQRIGLSNTQQISGDNLRQKSKQDILFNKNGVLTQGFQSTKGLALRDHVAQQQQSYAVQQPYLMNQNRIVDNLNQNIINGGVNNSGPSDFSLNNTQQQQVSGATPQVSPIFILNSQLAGHITNKPQSSPRPKVSVSSSDVGGLLNNNASIISASKVNHRGGGYANHNKHLSQNSQLRKSSSGVSVANSSSCTGNLKS